MKSILSLLEEHPRSNQRIMQGAERACMDLGIGFLHDPYFDWSHSAQLPVLADAVLVGRNRKDPSSWAQGLPLIATSIPHEGLPAVLPDFQAAGALACEHFSRQKLVHWACLINLNPHEPEHRALADGFSAAASKNGKSIHLFQNGRHVEEKWTLAGNILDLRDWISALPKPVGILCGDPDHAHRILRAIDPLEFSVPTDVAVLAYGMNLEHPHPFLSGIDPDTPAIGAAAVHLLHQQLQGEPLSSSPLLIPPKGDRVGPSTDRRFEQHPIVRRVIQDLERHNYTRRTVDEIASALGISKTTLNLAFREATGHSIGEELRTRRLTHGIHLLKTTDHSISGIAFTLGYEQSAHFSRDIRKQTGKTPKQVRG